MFSIFLTKNEPSQNIAERYRTFSKGFILGFIVLLILWQPKENLYRTDRESLLDIFRFYFYNHKLTFQNAAGRFFVKPQREPV